MRFAIIGVGNIAPIHAAAIRGVPGAELVAVATRHEGRGHAFVAEHGGRWYADYQELLERAQADAVAICTPHDLHAPMTLAAAQAGAHVLCEKPMARNVAECDAMIDACDRAGVRLGVVFPGRFEPLSMRLKTALDAGRLGRLLWASANTLWHRSDAYYRSGPWRGTWAHEGGGVLINQAIHTIDLLVWLTGLPERVTATMRTLNHSIEVEDAALAILEYAGGRLGLIQATTIAHPGYPERFDFFGSSGSVIYHKGRARLDWHLLDPLEDCTEEGEVSSGAARPMDITAAGHTALYNDFVAAIRADRSPVVDGHEGRRSMALVEAIYRSAAAGSSVALE
jgi:predicted dehydrogenase